MSVVAPIFLCLEPWMSKDELAVSFVHQWVQFDWVNHFGDWVYRVVEEKNKVLRGGSFDYSRGSDMHAAVGRILRGLERVLPLLHTLCSPLPLIVGETCDRDGSVNITEPWLGHIIWQRWKDSADVSKASNQLSLSELKGQLSCVGQARTGEPLKESLQVIGTLFCWLWRTSCHEFYSCKEMNAANNHTGLEGDRKPQMGPQPHLTPWLQPGENLSREPR